MPGDVEACQASSPSFTGQLAVPLTNTEGKAGSLSLTCSSWAALRAIPGVHTVSNPIRALLKQVVWFFFLVSQNLHLMGLQLLGS